MGEEEVVGRENEVVGLGNEAVKRPSAPWWTEKRSMRKSKRSMKKRHAVHAQNKTLHGRKNGVARKWRVRPNPTFQFSTQKESWMESWIFRKMAYKYM